MADLELRATVLPGEPLSLHVSLVNPVGPAGPRLVPRLLTPVGLWIAVTVLDRDGSTVWESTRPKAALKLHPMRRESYVEIGPGYSYGVDVRLAGLAAAAGGIGAVRVSYSNGVFTGPRESPVGTLEYATTVRLHAD
jgi:hypothetical protein